MSDQLNLAIPWLRVSTRHALQSGDHTALRSATRQLNSLLIQPLNS
jgi:hypothetical protein